MSRPALAGAELIPPRRREGIKSAAASTRPIGSSIRACSRSRLDSRAGGGARLAMKSSSASSGARSTRTPPARRPFITARGEASKIRGPWRRRPPRRAACAGGRRAWPSSEAPAPRRAFRDRRPRCPPARGCARSASAASRAASVRTFRCALARARGTVSVARGANTGRCHPPSRVQRQMLARPTPVFAAISP